MREKPGNVAIKTDKKIERKEEEEAKIKRMSMTFRLKHKTIKTLSEKCILND